MAKTKGISIKEPSQSVYDLILDKQTELKKKNRSLNMGQVANLLLEEAYLKEKK